MIRQVKSEDATQVCDIYNYYVEQTIVTFEESAVSVPDMESRII